MKRKTIYLLSLLLLMAVIVIAGNEATEDRVVDSMKADSASSMTTEGSDQLVVYYLHGNRRCMTCRKMEAYSEEAVATGFAAQLKDSSIIWQVANFEEEGNEHFAKDYQLYGQSLIVSKLHEGKEIEWVNLDKIWKLVRNKEQFITYVQTEVKDFMIPAEKE